MGSEVVYHLVPAVMVIFAVPIFSARACGGGSRFPRSMDMGNNTLFLSFSAEELRKLKHAI
jgi:hypothetical protein